MAATANIVRSGPDRPRLHPEICPKERTAEYDMPVEIVGLVPTLQRLLFSPWCGDRPRPPYGGLQQEVACVHYPRRRCVPLPDRSAPQASCCVIA
jgi:hypothetical protein